MKALLERLLQREPAERFQSAAELEEALRTRLMVVGPYDGAAALEEVHKAVADVGELLVAGEVTPGLLSPGAERGRAARELTTR